MLKKLLLTTALGGLMMSSAFAQSAQPPSFSSPPASSSDSSSKSDPMKSDSMKSDTSKSGSSASLNGASTIAAQKPDQLLASRVKGSDVIGSDGKKIGDVSDILFTKEGKIDAYVLSVGGFLGVGAKEVALAPSSVQLTQDKDNWQIKVSMTKDQLAQAPNFERYKEPRSTTGSASPGAGSPASAPKNAPAGNPPAQRQ